MNRQAETMAWLLSRLDGESYDEVTGWQRTVAAGGVVMLPEPADVPGALELGAWLDDMKPVTVEVPVSVLRGLADRLSGYGHAYGVRAGVEAALRDLATQPEQKAAAKAERQPGCDATSPDGYFTCTAHEDGYHIAAGTTGDVLARWPIATDDNQYSGRCSVPMPEVPVVMRKRPAGTFEVDTWADAPDDGGFLPGTACTLPSLSRLTAEAWRRERELRRNT